jgi:predicted RNase H-like nuclease
MGVVLGIDAAWTEKNPSGLALVEMQASRWRMVCAAPSYERFLGLAVSPLVELGRPLGSSPDPAALLAAAARLCGRPVDVVAVDMPLAHSAICSRRCSDNAVSEAYGGRKCGTHSPSAARPGVISDLLRQRFADAGYPLKTKSSAVPGGVETISAPALIEVYPHPALVELARASERLPYKYSKIRSYWRSATPAERRGRLIAQWGEIVALLDEKIGGVKSALPRPEPHASGVEMKAFEDMLDAIVCAWVGVCALEGRAVPYGDQDSAIWIPARPVAQSSTSAQAG